MYFLGRPLVIGVDIEVVPLGDHEAAGAELLTGDIYGRRGLLPLSVFGAAGQKRTHYELVYTLLVAG